MIKSIKKIVSYLKHVKKSNLKFVVEDKIAWTLIGRDIKLKQFEKMYNGYHMRYKYLFLKPIIRLVIWIGTKINKKILGKSLIPSENVSKEKCNRILNVSNKAFMQSLKEASLILKKDIEAYENPLIREHNRIVKTAYDVLMQNVIYDTVYRGIFEIWAINLALGMYAEYKNDPNHVLYNKRDLNNIDYYMAVQRNDSNHLVLTEPNGLVVIPQSAAIRLAKRDVVLMFEELDKKRKKEKATS